MEQIELLDHGYLKFVESWGSDERIIETARMSTDKGFRTWKPYRECQACKCWVLNRRDAFEGQCSSSEDGEHQWQNKPRGDEGLLKYMYEHKHSTPFEFAGLIVEIQAPIMVYREWHRHRTQSYSELSARYTPLPDLNYIPSVERLMLNSKSNKQAGTIDGAAVLDETSAKIFQLELESQYESDQKLYEWALKQGVPKELARVHLPVGRYSRMRAQANLRNWLHFLTLRMASNAQWEIRQYANSLGTYIEKLYPRTWNLFLQGENQ